MFGCRRRLGDWFYNRKWKFRPVSWVIHRLVEQWNAIHGEAIFGTRPWLVYVESAVKVKGGAFGEDFGGGSRGRAATRRASRTRSQSLAGDQRPRHSPDAYSSRPVG